MQLQIVRLHQDSPKWLTPSCISNPSAVLEWGHIMMPALFIRIFTCFSSGKSQKQGFPIWKMSCSPFQSQHQQKSDQQTFNDELSEGFNGLGVGQIQFPDDHVFISRVFQNVRPCLLSPLKVPARHHDTGPWDTSTDIKKTHLLTAFKWTQNPNKQISLQFIALFLCQWKLCWA